MKQKRYGDYTVVSDIHRGAFTHIYKVVDAENRPFALKVLFRGQLPLQDEASAKEIEERFRQAPQINEAFPGDKRFLLHHGQVQQQGDDLFYVTELLSSTVEDYESRQNGLSFPDILTLFRFFVSLLNDMHQKGASHRDLHLGQILLRDGFSAENLVLSDFDTWKNPENWMTYRVRGLMTRLQPSLRGVPGAPFDEEVRQGVIPKGADQRTDVWQLGLLLAEAILKRRFHQVQVTKDLQADMLAKLPSPILLVEGKRVNLVRFVELVEDILMERLTTIDDVEQRYSHKVIVTSRQQALELIVALLSGGLLIVTGLLYYQTLKIVGWANLQQMILLTTVYLGVSGFLFKLLATSRHLDGVPFLNRLALLLRGNMKSRLAAAAYLAFTSLILCAANYSDLKGIILTGMGFDEIGLDVKCRVMFGAASERTGNRRTQLANFERYLQCYGQYLEARDSQAAEAVITLMDALSGINDHAKMGVELASWAEQLEAIRANGDSEAPALLAEMLGRVYEVARGHPELDRADRLGLLQRLAELGGTVENEAARLYLHLFSAFERAAWVEIGREDDLGLWEPLSHTNAGAGLVEKARENRFVLGVSDAVRAKFFPGRYTTRQARRFLQQLCSTDVFEAGRLALQLELDQDFGVAPEEPHNKGTARDVAHLLQCSRYEGKRILVAYFSNTMGDSHELSALSRSRRDSFAAMVAEHTKNFGESNLRLEHTVFGAQDHLYDPFLSGRLNARIELSLVD